MSGKYTGLQARIKEKCEFAAFVPCAGHSLNLVGVHAAGCVSEKKVVKSLSQTRWSARADAVSALHEGHKQIVEALISIATDTEQAQETREEALSLSKKMGKLEFIILTEIWSSILERINKTSNYLQKATITLDVAINLFTALDDYIISLRDKFDHFESSAKEKNPESDYKDLSQRTRLRSSRLSFFDGSAPSVQLNGKERFKVETFIPIIDTLSLHLKQRLSSYKGISQRFGLFFRLKTLNSEELRQSCKEFAEIYYEDVNEKELEMECLHLTEYLKIDGTEMSKYGEVQSITKEKWSSSVKFANVFTGIFTLKMKIRVPIPSFVKIDNETTLVTYPNQEQTCLICSKPRHVGQECPARKARIAKSANDNITCAEKISGGYINLNTYASNTLSPSLHSDEVVSNPIDTNIQPNNIPEEPISPTPTTAETNAQSTTIVVHPQIHHPATTEKHSDSENSQNVILETIGASSFNASWGEEVEAASYVRNEKPGEDLPPPKKSKRNKNKSKSTTEKDNEAKDQSAIPDPLIDGHTQMHQVNRTMSVDSDTF
ncbi:unnamed protein product [Phaedon cochleariae]|uniref:Uncharacterized protein n=1 Tax=Phaedon cochleariae TaxID=80249 RepID=A0A9P0DMJ7_PHACE|nr:unnamed protein product [Phaedon cochleariae]